MPRSKAGLDAASILGLLLATISHAIAAAEDQTTWRTDVHANGYCAMTGICGRRQDGDVLNCASNLLAAQPSPDLALALKRTCPRLWSEQKGEQGRYCCSAEQVANIASNVSGMYL